MLRQQLPPQVGGPAHTQQQEVGGGGAAFQAERAGRLQQVFLAFADGLSPPLNLLPFGNGGDSSGLGRAVDAPTVLEAPHPPDDFFGGQHIAQAQAGQRVVLGHRAEQGDVAQRQQRGRVPRLFDEGDVGFIQRQYADAPHCFGDASHLFIPQIDPGGVVGVAKKHDGRPQNGDALQGTRQIPVERSLCNLETRGHHRNGHHALNAAGCGVLSESGRED